MTKILSASGGPLPAFSRSGVRVAVLVVSLASSLVAGRPACARSPEPFSSPESATRPPAAERGRYVRTATIGEVISRWRPETHLYVMGDVGLEDAVLADLAAWLSDRHWTVLLVADASGQVYRDAEGRTHTGEDAIEFGTGQGIPKRHGFAAQVHPETGEPDGAIFTVVLAQRALFYTGSEAQDRRDLGEAAFKGNLDQWAIQAMRAGGDVAGAVRGTVANVDSAVASAITEAARAAAQQVEDARSAVRAGAAAIATLEEKAAGLRKSHPGLSGQLVQPNLGELRQALATAEASLDRDPARAIEAAREVGNVALAQVQEIDRYPADGKALADAGTRIAELERRERAVAANGPLVQARQSLAVARELYDQGNPGYRHPLEFVRSHLADAEQRIAAADRAATTRLFLLGMLLCFAALGLAVVGFILNRHRRGAKREAEELLAAWRGALNAKLDALFGQLERRVARFVGPVAGEGKRPHAGETLRLAGEVRKDVGSLSILWTSASSVLQQAERLIAARGLGAAHNLFFPGKYRQGIRLLKEEPVPFDPADGLPRLFVAERTWRDDLLGDLASYQPFKKTFAEIVAEFDLRAGRAAAALDRIEAAEVQGPAALDEVDATVGETGARREAIERAGTADSYFLVPALWAAALPAAAVALAQARAHLPTDPVGAIEGSGTAARRIASDASRLAALVAEARAGSLAAITAGAAALRGAGHPTGWIDAALGRLSAEADRLAAQAAREPAAEGIDALAAEIAALASRVERAAALAGALGGTARPAIQRGRELVEAARRDVGAALGLEPDRMLREASSDPSERLDAAARQADAAESALGEGALDAAAAALAEAARLTSQANGIVEATREALAAREPAVLELRAETARLEGRVPDHERILSGIRERFAASVLALRDGDAGHRGANGTVGDNLDECRSHLDLSHGKLERSVAAFREGRLLAAAGLLREVRDHQDLARHRLEELAEKEARLERTLGTNRELLATLEDRVRQAEGAIPGDPRTRKPTLAAFAEMKERLRAAREAVEAAKGDPFLAEEELLAARAALDHVELTLAPADHNLFAEAGRSVEAAGRELAAAGGLARRAAEDQVGDSPEIVRSRQLLEPLAAGHAEAREALAVPHGDWDAVDAEADRIAAESARLAATLRGELEQAEAAVAAIANAAASVRAASTWRGAYAAVDSGPGAERLSRARSLLEEGRYREAAEAGEGARQTADAALAWALQEEARRQAAAEAERRRREAAERERYRSSHGSSGAGWGGGGSSGGSSWGGSSSGSSRSSFGGSSSGSGKSGW